MHQYKWGLNQRKSSQVVLILSKEKRREGKRIREMAGGMAVSSTRGDGGAEFDGRMNKYVILCCIVASTGGLMFGYDIGISGTYLHAFNQLIIKAHII